MAKNINNDDNVLGILTHILGMITSFIGPLIIYLAIDKKNTFVREHAKEALNFQMTLIIAGVASMILMLVLIGFLLIFAISILNIVFCIMGAVAAGNRTSFKYPVNIRFMK
jgi:uncharacterized Tic20 family protein